MRISDHLARGEKLDVSCSRRIGTYIVRSFLIFGPSGTARNREDIMHKAMVLLDMHLRLLILQTLCSGWLRSTLSFDPQEPVQVESMLAPLGLVNISLDPNKVLWAIKVPKSRDTDPSVDELYDFRMEWQDIFVEDYRLLVSVLGTRSLVWPGLQSLPVGLP